MMMAKRDILIDNSGYHLLNMGDVAMLQVGVRRLAALLPGYRLQVLTSDPTRLTACCPQACPVPPWDNAIRNLYAQNPQVLSHRFRTMHWRLRSWQPACEAFVERWPWLHRRCVQERFRDQPELAREYSRLQTMVRSCAMVISTGGGFLTDAFEDQGRGILWLLLAARRQGIPVAMLGQGVGPITDPVYADFTRQTLSVLNLLGLREPLGYQALMGASAQVSQGVFVTGDDAIALAFQYRSDTLGERIGFNLRKAAYAAVAGDTADQVSRLITRQAAALQRDIQLVPISVHKHERDDQPVLANQASQVRVHPLTPQSPQDVIRAIGTCRFVVTGSYHAGVFALAQGIPVIGLVKSAYYVDKFRGLSTQFGRGCRYVHLQDNSWQEDLTRAMQEYHQQAPTWRQELLRAAEEQIRTGENCYAAIPTLLKQRRSVSAD